MSRFNTATKTRSPKTVNRAGGEAFEMDARQKLVALVLSSMVQDQYYRSAKETLSEIRELVSKDPLFAAKAAIYARHEFGMRSVSHAVAGELSEFASGQEWAKRFFERVVYRPDDVTEIVAYVWNVHGVEPTNAMKKGLGAALAKFDAYQIGKYQSKGKDISLVDAVNLLHPPHTEPLKALVEGTISAPDTWEVKKTRAGQDGEDQGEVWKRLIEEEKLGHMALLRNLRNIWQEAPDVLDPALEQLTQETAVYKSKMLPFRYLAAYKQLQSDAVPGKILAAISRAMDLSVHNIPTLPGKSAILVDASGSMTNGSVSGMHGTIKPADIAALFAAALYKGQAGDVFVFASRAQPVGLNPADSTLTLSERINGTHVGHATNLNAGFERLRDPYDRIFVLSDMQSWVRDRAAQSAYERYCSKHDRRPMIYSWDLQGYGTTQFSENALLMAGWNSRALDLIEKLETDRNALVEEIEQVSI